MFRKFFEFWRGSGFLREATEEVERMLLIAKDMFKLSLQVLMDKEKDEDIYRIDQELNRFQISVRRKILEHLSINPRQDITGALVLITIVIDIERIGDYSKNLIELAHKYPKRLSGSYIDKLRRIEGEILEMFDQTITSFKSADIELGKRIMERHVKLSRKCEDIVEALVEDKEISSRIGIICALLARYLKRTSAHLKNVASSVVNPFHRLGYRPET